ncbi:hypothetical protein KY316_02605, partial [Candidatus Woesearchaeota archaeon]|nr:hypothetical protein [Candidatus Woesearchaeota archaeon]
METALWAIVVVSLSTFIGAVGQYCFKKGADSLTGNLLNAITNKYLITGIGAYAVGSIIFVLVLPYGEVSTLYPFIALNYIWVAWVSKKFLNEEMNVLKW